MHDPSTVIEYGGRFYSFGTGAGLPFLVSGDGWEWHRGGTLMSAVPGGKPGQAVLDHGGNNTWAPDVIRIGDKIFVYYAAPGTQPRAAIGLLVGRSLDPQSPTTNGKTADRWCGPTAWKTAMPSIPEYSSTPLMGACG